MGGPARERPPYGPLFYACGAGPEAGYTGRHPAGEMQPAVAFLALQTWWAEQRRLRAEARAEKLIEDGPETMGEG